MTIDDLRENYLRALNRFLAVSTVPIRTKADERALLEAAKAEREASAALARATGVTK